MHKGGRFIEACLLSLLKEGTTHGYRLMEKLIQNEFVEANINISIIYRTLRGMEKDSLVTSSWEESDHGPNKRLYSITTKGVQELDNWIILIKNKRKQINLIIKMYEEYEC